MNITSDLDYGPLKYLIGAWSGDKGLDIAPEPDGKENNPYYETMVFTAADDVTNAEEQVLTAVHYRQIVKRKSNDNIFHDQTGYWMWDAESQIVMHSIVIPRGVCVLAGGKYNKDLESQVCIEVGANINDKDWGIIQSPFMQEKACTTGFEQQVTVSEQRLSYSQTTIVDIYGKVFKHTDTNELSRQ